MPLVLLVIVNWNGKEEVLCCLDSIKCLDYPKEKLKVVVVDNGSIDGSAADILKHYPDTLLFQNARNIGYVQAVNQGVIYGMGLNIDYIWVLNNDVIVDSQALKRLVDRGEQDENVGVLAPLIYSYERPDVVEQAGFKINFWTGHLKKLRVGRSIFKNPQEEFCDIDSILGCANLIKASVFRKIGYFRPIYELYFEEMDFNVRAHKAGFRVVVIKDASVRHKEAATMNKMIFRRAYLLLRNLLTFELLNAELKHLLVFIPYYFFIHLPYFLLRGSIYGIQVKLKHINARQRRI